MIRMRRLAIAAILISVGTTACGDDGQCTTKNAVPINGVCGCPPGTQIDAKDDQCVTVDSGIDSITGVTTAEDGGLRSSDAGTTLPGSNDAGIDAGPVGADAGSPEPDAAVVAPSVAQIAAGGTHTCARLTDGSVKCWGGNDQGQLGDGTRVDRTAPTTVSGLAKVVEIAAGYYHTCARLEDRSLRCWGGNGFGELGDGTNAPQSAPVAVRDVHDAEQVVAGGGYSCVRTTTGDVKCWGANTQGQLGDGTMESSRTPRPATLSESVSPVVNVTAGAAHACAQLASGEVRCWGRNDRGQVGESLTAVRPAQISAGAVHTCVASTRGEAICWGDNRRSQLGSSGTNSAAPVRVAGLTEVEQVAAGGGMSCARLRDGSVRCWGDTYAGSLGDGSPTGDAAGPAGSTGRATPVQVVGVSSAVEISAGEYHACARLASGAVKCWGENEKSQLGDGTSTDRSTPVDVPGLVP